MIAASVGVGACATNAEVCAMLFGGAEASGVDDGAPLDGERGHGIPAPWISEAVDG